MKMVLYQITDQLNNPIYVGITKNQNKRFYYHDLAVRTPNKAIIRNDKTFYPHQTYLYNKLRKIISEYPDYILADHLIVLNTFDTYQELLEAEVKTIQDYKLKGIVLCNLTIGGDGTPGRTPIFTDEWRANLSKAKRKYFDEGGKNSFAGKKHKQESLDKHKKTLYENIKSGKTKPLNHNRIGKTNIEIFGEEKAKIISEKISKKNKGILKPHTPEWEKNRINAMQNVIRKTTYFITNLETNTKIIWNKSLGAFDRLNDWYRGKSHYILKNGPVFGFEIKKEN